MDYFTPYFFWYESDLGILRFTFPYHATLCTNAKDYGLSTSLDYLHCNKAQNIAVFLLMVEASEFPTRKRPWAVQSTVESNQGFTLIYVCQKPNRVGPNIIGLAPALTKQLIWDCTGLSFNNLLSTTNLDLAMCQFCCIYRQKEDLSTVVPVLNEMLVWKTWEDGILTGCSHSSQHWGQIKGPDWWSNKHSYVTTTRHTAGLEKNKGI